jgi:hypothetical protein
MRLVYGIDRQLRDGDRLLAGFEEDSLWGWITVDNRRYEIVRQERRGWHFRLVDLDAGQDAREYVPFRVARGGRVLGGQAPVTLRPVPLRPRKWTFANETGWQVDAKVVDSRSKRAVSDRAQKPRSPYEVQLGGLPSPDVSPEISMLLAFGCWIVIEAASMKIPDYGR